MQGLSNNLFNSSFSHIYFEENALEYATTRRILERFQHAQVIKINHYKDVFSRSHQNYSLQNKTFKLILAVKQDNLIYDGAKVCEDFGNEHFYYTSTMMNCIYDCEYCYLQGMYSSANLVIFVNIEDIFNEVKQLLYKHPVYLCVSYDTDILAMENVIGYGEKWINFAKDNKALTIELRTKSSNFKAIEKIESQENVILAWTVSPDTIIKQYENKTPSLGERLRSIKGAIDKGWKVRLCFDPLLYVNGWKKHYKELIERIFSEIPADKIVDISIGVFRVSKDYLKRMRKQKRHSIILNYPYETVEGICSYEEKLSKDMIDFVSEQVKKHIDDEKIFS